MHRFAGQRIAVVMGGLSAEREVSLDTGAGVLAALPAEAVQRLPASSTTAVASAAAINEA